MNTTEMKAFLTKFQWNFEGCFINPQSKASHVVLRSPVVVGEGDVESQKLNDVVVLQRNKMPDDCSSYTLIMPEGSLIPFMKEWGMSVSDDGFLSYLNNLKEWAERIQRLRADVGTFQTERLFPGKGSTDQATKDA